MNRYKAKGAEAEYQPGSGGRVLVNKLGIGDESEMDGVELDLLNALYSKVLDSVSADQVLSVTEIKEWHRSWLGNVYDWAGQERSVNLAKGDFHFAVASQVPRLMDEFDRRYLASYTPCQSMTDEELIEALAVVHVEFILIHPFR